MTEPNSVNKSDLSDLYQRLMDINQEAFAREWYDVGYHALAGALYCAQILNDLTYLIEVENIASQQLEWIDDHHPEYQHSTASASRRGHQCIYKNLINQARKGAQLRQEVNRKYRFN